LACAFYAQSHGRNISRRFHVFFHVQICKSTTGRMKTLKVNFGIPRFHFKSGWRQVDLGT
jgi:hypothetical protein